MNDRRIIICKSIHHRNTRAVAEQMADILGATVEDPDNATSALDGSTTLLGVGSGIYFGRFHRSLRDWIRRLPTNGSTPCKVFILSTSGLPFLSRLYHWPLRRALERRGYRVIGEFSCRGHDSFGLLWLIGGLNRKHPDASDLDRARAFARQISRLASGEHDQRCDSFERKISA
jgi:flavodoxin